MPVTARLSKRFYDQFGEDIANELVDWLNKVDAAQKSEFRELLERHSERLDGKLDQLRNEMKAEFANVRADQVRWLFLAWATLLIPLIGLWTR